MKKTGCAVEKIMFLVCLHICLHGYGASGALSAPAFIHLTPETSSFWHTATNQVITVPVTFPFGASSATLSVRGTRYAHDYEDITTSSFTFYLPEAGDLSQEDVYALTLTFDDGTVHTARLALANGVQGGAWGSTRCLRARTGDWKWSQGNGVLPVPYGTSSLTVDGVAVTEGDRGFTGAQGWYALGRLRCGQAVNLELSVGAQAHAAAGICRAYVGTLLILR